MSDDLPIIKTELTVKLKQRQPVPTDNQMTPEQFERYCQQIDEYVAKYAGTH